MSASESRAGTARPDAAMPSNRDLERIRRDAEVLRRSLEHDGYDLTAQAHLSDVAALCDTVTALRLRLAERDAECERLRKYEEDWGRFAVAEIRLQWCVRHSAQLFTRDKPVPAAMLAYFPRGQKGFATAESSGGAVPAYTAEVLLSQFAGDLDSAVRVLIDRAMKADGVEVILVPDSAAVAPAARETQETNDGNA